ncbi:hypothetical protein B7P43_G03476 [Cryptotermes secundus]|uniref:Uncharacterized protein n=1 Tax=Cryptotermes secundus TaxID=105785 RepID=A0A2J7QZK9_9NEOP|nr:hypothetical protein B7P43_G03476 [Cryptotermes secundus]
MGFSVTFSSCSTSLGIFLSTGLRVTTSGCGASFTGFLPRRHGTSDLLGSFPSSGFSSVTMEGTGISFFGIFFKCVSSFSSPGVSFFGTGFNMMSSFSSTGFSFLGTGFNVTSSFSFSATGSSFFPVGFSITSSGFGDCGLSLGMGFSVTFSSCSTSLGISLSTGLRVTTSGCGASFTGFLPRRHGTSGLSGSFSSSGFSSVTMEGTGISFFGIFFKCVSSFSSPGVSFFGTGFNMMSSFSSTGFSFLGTGFNVTISFSFSATGFSFLPTGFTVTSSSFGDCGLSLGMGFSTTFSSCSISLGISLSIGLRVTTSGCGASFTGFLPRRHGTLDSFSSSGFSSVNVEGTGFSSSGSACISAAGFKSLC